MSRLAACDGDEPGVPNHAVIGTHAAFGDVPPALQRLERFDVVEAAARQSEHELLHLPGLGR